MFIRRSYLTTHLRKIHGLTRATAKQLATNAKLVGKSDQIQPSSTECGEGGSVDVVVTRSPYVPIVEELSADEIPEITEDQDNFLRDLVYGDIPEITKEQNNPTDIPKITEDQDNVLMNLIDGDIPEITEQQDQFLIDLICGDSVMNVSDEIGEPEVDCGDGVGSMDNVIEVPEVACYVEVDGTEDVGLPEVDFVETNDWNRITMTLILFMLGQSLHWNNIDLD